MGNRSKQELKRNRFSRRQLLKDGVTLTLASSSLAAITYLSHTDQPVRKDKEKIHTLRSFALDNSIYPNLVIVRGVDHYKMVKAAVDRIGGIRRYIEPGDKVVIKPNVAWDRSPEQGANSNPTVVAALVKILIQEAKASSVIVTDVSLNNPARSFARSGIKDAVENAGGKIWIPADDDYRMTDLKGELLKVWPVANIYHFADKVINLPVLKHHSLSKATIAMKNWYGALGGKRNRLHQKIDQSIFDLASAFKPTFTIVDATRVLMRNGPTGGSLDDVLNANLIAIGFDEVALDSFGLSILGVEPETVGYMRLANQYKLGNIHYKSGSFDEIST